MRPSTQNEKDESLTRNTADDDLGKGNISNDHQRGKKPEVHWVRQ